MQYPIDWLPVAVGIGALVIAVPLFLIACALSTIAETYAEQTGKWTRREGRAAK